MISEIISLFTPLLLHMLLSEAVVVFLGNRFDVTTCTAITALAVIPVAVWMYLRDCGKRIFLPPVRFCRRPSGGADDYRKRLRQLAFGFFCFGAGGILNILWSRILNQLHIGEYFSNQTQEQLLAARMMVQVIGLGVLVPAAEELIFRALIYRRMKRMMPLWAAVILSCALFAVYHGNMIQMIFAFPMALILTWVYERGKSFAFPFLFHMGANLTAVFWNFFL